MLGFSDLLKSNFADSAKTLTSLLEPHLKKGQDAATAHPPQFFDTPVGERHVPRDKDPKKPNYEMIKDARKGTLSGFLRSGEILRASDFVGIVNPKTGIITLQEIYEFETRHLTAIDDQSTPRPPLSSMVPFKKVADNGADKEKTLRNLFFITLAHDELPSFHFWTKPGDLDPVTAGKPMDWGKYFDENPPSPTTTTKIATLESERKENAQRGAEEQRSSQNKKPLGFLDRYSDNNLPGLGREPTQGHPPDDIDSILQTGSAPLFAQPPIEAEVLLQFERGGMYLREFTHKALYAMACWLTENEEEDEEEDEKAKKDPIEIKDMFLDILAPGEDPREEKIASVSRVSNRNFQDNIKPILGRPNNKYRVRSTRFQSWWNCDSDFDSGGVGDMKCDLKLVRPNVGYCYCSANWHVTGDLRSNSLRFGKALKFLFDWKLSAYPKSNHLSLDIPGHGSFDLDRSSDLVVNAFIQEIFAELSDTPGKPDSRPVEIVIRDVVDDVTDGSDFLGTSSPRHVNLVHEKRTEVPDVLQGPSRAGTHADRGSIITSEIPDLPPSDFLGSLTTGQLLGHSSIDPTEIHGGPDLPSIHPRLLTNSEIIKLQERLKIAEASLVETDDLQERLRTAEEKLSELSGLQERLKASEARARLKSSCPFCTQDWAGATKPQQQDHLKLHQKFIIHQPASQKCPQPNCTSWLGENQRDSTYEQQEEHESIHHNNTESDMERDQLQAQIRGLEETQEKPDRLQEQAEKLEDIAKERDLLQQQIRDLQDAANERDRLQEDLIDLTEERDSFKDWASELEGRLKAASDLDEGAQTKRPEPEPETEVDEYPKQPSQTEAPKKLRYCNVCLKSVDKMSANANIKHADKCDTSVSEVLLFTPTEAKARREKRSNSGVMVRPQTQQGTEEEVEMPNTGKKRKKKASARAAPSESQQDEGEDAKTAEQPEASKASGHKRPKHKIDTFKPPREDESDEDIESPKKKPKLKAKAVKADMKETTPTRRSTRGKDVYEPPDEEGEDGEDGEEAENEPSASAKGGKRKKRAAAVATASKKSKTKK
ncbi:MAG: hypothetical protein ASARMPRED_008980 [Alectoria sarmentosa]|nr:MAG: hypothetical protein ASARMPRED_008980 [Alectoria sarmentosa]